MTISTEIRKAGPFSGNGSTTVFPFTFKVFAASDLYVVKTSTTDVETVLALGTSYTVTLNPDQDASPGGSVTVLAAPAIGEKLTISTDVADTQPADITNQSGFYPQVVEDALDRSTIQIQQLQEKMSRAIKLPISTNLATVSAELPAPVGGRALIWNDEGTRIINGTIDDFGTAVLFSDSFVDTFTGDGTQVDFTLSASPGSLNNLTVAIDGVLQVPGGDYLWPGEATLRFTSAPPTGTAIYVRYARVLSQTDVFSDLASTETGKGASLVGVEGGGTVQSVAGGFKRRRSLGGMGVNNGDDATAALQSLFSTAQAGDHIVIDRDVTYTATTQVTLSVSDVVIECTETGSVTCPNINNATNAAFLAIAGTQVGTTSIPSGNLVAGKYFIDVASTSGVQIDDLICIKTNKYFNGLSAVSGWDLINQQEWLRVRNVASATQLRFTNPLVFNTPNADIVTVEIHRPVRNVRVINPKFYGPGTGGATITNGNGARCMTVNRVLDFKCEGGFCSGWPGYVAQVFRFENAWFDGMTMDSGEPTLTTQAFYGISHEGGRGGHVSNCVGRNMRRVADTGGGATVTSNGLLAIDILHENIRGELMNGSAAGTHHALNYVARNIEGFACPTVMTIRSKVNDIDGVIGFNIAGQLILTGPGLDYSDVNATIDLCKMRNLYISGTVDGAVRGSALVLYANGRYDIEGEFYDHDSVGINVRGEYVNGFRFKGRMFGVSGTLATTNIFFVRGKLLADVDIQDCEFGNAATADILLNGTSDPASPAENIVIRNNVGRSAVTNQFQFNPAGTPGFIKGETTRIEGNIGTAGGTTNPVQIGNPTYWTAQPTLQGNRKVYDGSVGFSTFTRGDNAPVCVGRFANAAAIPSGTTVLAGDWFEVTNPGAGNYAENQVTFAGTVGAIAGVTGGITAAQTTLVMVGNDATKVGLGSIITVAGSGVSVYRVIAISADYTTATLNTPAATTVAGAAVQYRNPTFKGRNLLQV